MEVKVIKKVPTVQEIISLRRLALPAGNWDNVGLQAVLIGMFPAFYWPWIFPKRFWMRPGRNRLI